MPKFFFLHNFSISARSFLGIILLVSPSLAWFYVLRNCISEIQEMLVSQNLSTIGPFDGIAVFFLSIVISAIVGCLASERVKLKKFLLTWILVGILSNSLLLFVKDFTSLLILSSFAGISFGIGFSSSLAFLAESTKIEERARISGLVILFTYLTAILVLGLGFAIEATLQVTIILSIILRGVSLFALLLIPIERIPVKQNSWSNIFSEGFKYYFVSWIIFIIADGVGSLVQNWLPEEITASSIGDSGAIISYLGIVFSSALSGVVSDRYGRRKTIIFGLSILVISYTFFSVMTTTTTYLLVMLFYGAAWGIIIVNYFITVIGDFAIKANSSIERFYTIGAVMPFILLTSVDIFSGLLGITVPTSEFSIILSILIFISIIPLFGAPETLPEKVIKARKLKNHLKKVKKIIEEES